MSRYIVIDKATNRVTNVVIGQSLAEIQALHPDALVFDAQKEAVGPDDIWLPKAQAFERASPPEPATNEAAALATQAAWTEADRDAALRLILSRMAG